MYRNEDLTTILRGAGVSSSSIDTAGSILGKIFGGNNDIIDKNEYDSTREKKRRRKELGESGSSPQGKWINLIPSDIQGPCTDLLLVTYLGYKEFEKFSMEAIETCIGCHSTIKAVLLAGDMWDDPMFTEWRKPSFERLYDSFGICLVSLVLIGGNWKVTPIISP